MNRLIKTRPASMATGAVIGLIDWTQHPRHLAERAAACLRHARPGQVRHRHGPRRRRRGSALLPRLFDRRHAGRGHQSQDRQVQLRFSPGTLRPISAAQDADSGYLMVTGSADMPRGTANFQYAHSIVYVAEGDAPARSRRTRSPGIPALRPRANPIRRVPTARRRPIPHRVRPRRHRFHHSNPQDEHG